MPVTAKLSKLFYERLGDQIANELVEWFNKVDDSYKADLRQMNDLNWARFEAKYATKQDLSDMKAELKSDITGIRNELADFKGEVERRLGEQTRWTAGALLAMVLPMIGILVGVWRR